MMHHSRADRHIIKALGVDFARQCHRLPGGIKQPECGRISTKAHGRSLCELKITGNLHKYGLIRGCEAPKMHDLHFAEMLHQKDTPVDQRGLARPCQPQIFGTNTQM